jgi:Family of unknown function (DUF6076)
LELPDNYLPFFYARTNETFATGLLYANLVLLTNTYFKALDGAMKRPAKPVLLNPPTSKDLDHIVTILNSEPPSGFELEVRDELRGLVTRWQQSGPNLNKMLAADRPLWSKMAEAAPARWWATNGARSHFVPLPGDSPDVATPVDKAIVLFTVLTLNPDCVMLSGPCPSCSKFFLKKTAKHTLYCSRACSQRHTAQKATAAARKEAHEKKLRHARALTTEWETKRTSEPWKAWVSTANPDISISWLTRAVNNGELTEPVKYRKTA